MISCTFASLSFISIPSLTSKGTLHLPCYTGRMLVSSLMEWYSPGILPSLSKESGNISFRFFMLWIVYGPVMGEQLLYVLEKGKLLGCSHEKGK